MAGLLVDPNMPITPEIPETPQQPQMGGMPPMGGQPPMPTGADLMAQGGMPAPAMGGQMPTLDGMVSNVDELAAIEQAGMLPQMPMA